MTAQVGIDIGATGIRIVEVNGVNSDSFAQITKAHSVKLPPGLVTAGRIKDPAAVAAILRPALKAAGVNPYGVVVGLSSPDTAIAQVKMPRAVKPSEWTSVLRTNGQQISAKIPVEKSTLSLYDVDPQSSAGMETQRTLLAAATVVDELEALLQVCRLAKVTPRAVDLSGAASLRCLTRTGEGNNDVATLVDIGASKTTVATRQGTHLRSLRTLEGGGERITRSLMGALSTTAEKAEALKMSTRIEASGQSKRRSKAAELAESYGAVEQTKVNDNDDSNTLQESLSSSVDALVDSIAAAIEADAAKHADHPTQGVLLCGGTALLRGLKERLVQRIGVPAVLGRPWAVVVPGRATEHLLREGTADEVALLSLSTATGLAMWKEAH